MIAILLPDLRAGGAERVNLTLAHEFARAGHRVEFVLRRARGELLEEAREAFDVFDLGCDRVRQVAPALARYLRARRPQALIASMWPLTALAPLVRSVAWRPTRILVAEHGLLSQQYDGWGPAHRLALRASTAIGYRAADTRVGVSHGVADDMAALSCMRRARFDVISNPVPLGSRPSVEEIARAESMWGVPKGKRILTVGSLKPVKNQALLIRAFARCSDSDARLMLVGGGQCERPLRELAKLLGLENRVVFAGYQTDPTAFYRTADVFALSSDREGFGNVIVEALGAGLSVVCTDCPSGPRDILVDGKYGTLVPGGDELTLAEALENSLSNVSRLERLQERAAQFAPAIAARAYLDKLVAA